MWLPRLMFKARAALADGLPPDYKLVFGHPQAMDGRFLVHFGLALDDVLAAAARPAEEDAAWFLGRPGVDAARLGAWNELAPNLGRTGYPMTKQLAWALAHFCPHLDPASVPSIFALLDLDEGRA
jgi:hypothetical protein